MELVQLRMLNLVPFFIFDTVFDKKLIDLRLKQEGDVDQVFTKLVEEACGSLLLECFQLVQICSQLI